MTGYGAGSRRQIAAKLKPVKIESKGVSIWFEMVVWSRSKLIAFVYVLFGLGAGSELTTYEEPMSHVDKSRPRLISDPLAGSSHCAKAGRQEFGRSRALSTDSLRL